MCLEMLLVVDKSTIQSDYLVGDIDVRFVDGVDGIWFEDDRAKGNVDDDSEIVRWKDGCIYERLVVHSNM